ncbi:MAG TPA: hypothetical protein VNN07_02140 [Candidatus Tectomicrobia bacterium]|nr:hypothetical protein [Candidatus Tectomicrobia bacterium]
MNASALPVPPAIWARLIAFLEAGTTGQVTLNVGQGRVTSAEFREHVRGEPGRTA